MTIAAIDFGRLYRDHLAAAGRQPKPASAWDGRVHDVDRKSPEGGYVDEFIARMDLSGCTTLLDVGCGSGAICLPLAPYLQQVYALDYSRAMLDALRTNAVSCGAGNVEMLHLAWEDDWSQVPECDIVVASRSTQVEDMAAALAKLHAKARKRVYLTHRIGGHFIAPEIVEAIGRRQSPPPDYIYILNILHGMGIHARVDHLRSDGSSANTDAGFDRLLRRTEWALGALDEAERMRLRGWFDIAGDRVRDAFPPRHWAFISWEKAAI